MHHDNQILVTTRDLTQDELWTLRRIPEVFVSNSNLDYDAAVWETERNLAELADYEESVANRDRPGDNLLWKLYVSVKDRYRRSLKEALQWGNVLHFDADTLVKKPLDPLFRMINRHDVCIKFKDYECKQGQVLGSLISIKDNRQARTFLGEWHKIIDKKKVSEMPRGFGQISFYQAYLKTRDYVNFGRIPDSFIRRGKRLPRHKHGKTDFSGWKSDYIDKIK
jgi:hypothetical protein